MLLRDEINNNPLYSIMHAAAQQVDPKAYFEIGTREGGSVSLMLDWAPRLQTIVVSDTWGGEYGGTSRGNPDHIVKLLDDRQYTGFFLALTGDSKQTVPTMTAQFDMILVDGDHSANGASTDIKNCWPLLRTGGILVVDDIVLHPYIQGIFDSFASSVPSKVFEKRTDHYGCAALVKF